MKKILEGLAEFQGDFAKAVEVLEGVVNAQPKVAIFHYHLGMAYAKAGNKAKAKAAPRVSARTTRRAAPKRATVDSDSNRWLVAPSQMDQARAAACAAAASSPVSRR